MSLKKIKGNLLLLLTAIIWGLAFVAQDKALEYIKPATVNALRSLLGAAVILPFAYFRSRKKRVRLFEFGSSRRDLIVSGILCGVFLCIATNLQQLGLYLYPDGVSSAGRGGFITALYVVLGPLSAVFMKRKIPFSVWVGVLLAAAGMYFLCLSSGFHGIYFGDVALFFCAFAFAAQILCIDIFLDRVDGVKLSAMQFFVSGIISLIISIIFERPTFADILPSIPYILYLGIMSSGIAYTLQIIGQQYSQNPTLASIIMSLESVFAALGGFVILGQALSVREIIGCVLMFAAIIFAQLPDIFRRETNN